MRSKSAAPLQTRVGIATGLVVVGDLIGSGEAQERGIVGETPNLAARLQGIAEPNTVVIAESTRKLLGNLFELAGPRGKGPQGHRRAGAGLGGAAAKFGGKPLRGAARDRPDRAGRAGRRTRIAAAALVEGKDRRRPGGAALRRGRYRQIAAHGRAAGTPRRANRTRACAISARRSTPTARFIRSSARWNAPPDWRTTTPRKRSSTSSMRCSRRPRPRIEDAALFAEMLSLPNDGRYPALDLTPQQRRQRTLEALDFADGGADTPKSGADDLRGCALDRPHEPGSVRSGRGPDRNPSRAADRDVPAGVRAAVDRTAARDRPHPQSAGGARNRRHDRRASSATSCCRRASGRTSSSAPTAFRCSWRR